MIRSELLSYERPGRERQRVQLVRWDDWASLRFLRPGVGADALRETAQIYRRFLIPAAPWVFGQLLLFALPEGGEAELRAAAETLRRGLRLRGGEPRFSDKKTRALWETLSRAGCVELVRGRLPFLRVLPVRSSTGLLSESEPDARLRVNASFFIFDPFDCATRYDTVGTPFGLAVEDGEVLSPPLCGREALFVYRDGRVRVETPTLEDLTVRIGDKAFRPGRDGAVYARPGYRKTPRGRGFDHVIVGRTLVDVVRGGGCPVPASGFVLRLAEQTGEPGGAVAYGGMEGLLFGVQAGNSLVRGGAPTEGFVSRFWNVREPWRTPFPPSLYPLDYEKARAARIALGADAAGKPLLLWAEGAAKIGHRPGEDSCGASLSEFAAICRDVGMVEGVNLDGGGSAQILLDGKRALQISDRRDDGSEQERAVPLGLMVK
ncbi:MAG: phosphodiester glycosidase family protein [Oscillospiraceae bacterium]|nr:phosphodiester glycosidase family protein [Oscillospiraceae bacterium]